MADAKEKVIALLSSTASVDMKTAANTSLYTVPTGKSCVVTSVVVRGPTASLAGGTDYDLGFTSATYADWVDGQSLATMTTATTDAFPLFAPQKVTIGVAAEIFKLKVNTGSTLAATTTIDVFGYIF